MAVVSPVAFQLPLMPASTSSSPPRRASATSLHQHHPSAVAGSMGGSSALDDEDLLSLGAFKLDTARDQELLCLQSFLKGVLPAGAAGGGSAHPPALNAGLTLANAAQGGWSNGWKPEGGAGSAAPWGSPMSFASTASVPLGSSSLSHHSASSFHPSASPFSPPSFPQHFHHQQQQQQIYPSPQSFAAQQHSVVGSSFAGGGAPGSVMTAARGTWAAATSPGYRAPACSRERVPTLSGLVDSSAEAFGAGRGGGGQGGAGAGGAGAEDGWKGRLRPRKPPAPDPSQQPRRQAFSDLREDDDAMME